MVKDDFKVEQEAVEQDSVEQESGFIQALRQGNLAAVKKLATEENIHAEFPDPKLGRANPMLLVAMLGELKIFEFLRSLNAKTEVKPTDPYASAITALEVAIRYEASDIVQYCIRENFIINRGDPGVTLHYFRIAIKYDRTEMVRFFLKEKIIHLEDLQKNEHFSELELAVSSRSLNTLKCLIEEFNAPVVGPTHPIAYERRQNLNLFHVAAIHLNKAALKYLDWFDPALMGQLNGLGQNALHLCLDQRIENDHLLSCLKFLLDLSGTHLWVEDRRGFTPLIYAIHNGLSRALSSLIDHCIRHEIPWNARVSKNEFSDFWCHSQGNSPFHAAISANQIGIAKQLIGLGCKNLFEPNAEGYTPFLTAVERGSLEAVEFLLDLTNSDYKKQRELFEQVTSRGENAVFIACRGGSSKLLEFFWAYDPTFFDNSRNNKNLLFLAVEGDHIGTFEFLLNHKIVQIFDAEGAQIRDERGQTLLQRALQTEDEPDGLIPKALIEKYKVPLDEVDSEGNTVFLLATKQSATLGVLERLLRRDPSMIFHRNQAGKTALHLAAEKNDGEVLTFLIKNGADVEAEFRVALSTFKTAIQCTDNAGCRRILENAVELMKVARMRQFTTRSLEELLQNGASLFQMDDEGRTPLHLAAEYGNLGLIEAIFSQRDVAINYQLKDKQGRTMLDLAKEKDHYFLLALQLFKYVFETEPSGDGSQKIQVFFGQMLSEISKISDLVLKIKTYLNFWEKLKSSPKVCPKNADEIIQLIFKAIEEIGHEYAGNRSFADIYAKKIVKKAEMYLFVGKRFKELPGYTKEAEKALQNVLKHIGSIPLTELTSVTILESANAELAQLIHSGRLIHCDHNPVAVNEETVVSETLLSLESDDPLDTETLPQVPDGKGAKENAMASSMLDKALDLDKARDKERGLWHLFQAGSDPSVVRERTLRTHDFLGGKFGEDTGIDLCSAQGKIDFLKMYRSTESKHAEETRRLHDEMINRDRRLAEQERELQNRNLKLQQLQEDLARSQGENAVYQRMFSKEMRPEGSLCLSPENSILQQPQPQQQQQLEPQPQPQPQPQLQQEPQPQPQTLQFQLLQGKEIVKETGKQKQTLEAARGVKRSHDLMVSPSASSFSSIDKGNGSAQEIGNDNDSTKAMGTGNGSATGVSRHSKEENGSGDAREPSMKRQRVST